MVGLSTAEAAETRRTAYIVRKARRPSPRGVRGLSCRGDRPFSQGQPSTTRRVRSGSYPASARSRRRVLRSLGPACPALLERTLTMMDGAVTLPPPWPRRQTGVAIDREQKYREMAIRGKYHRLYTHLCSRPAREWRTTFREIESIAGFDLPSARLPRPWWSNQRSGNVAATAVPRPTDSC